MKYDLQRSFSSGELSELTHMRNDYGDVYDSGLSLMENMVPNARGPAETRESLSFSFDLAAEPDARLEVLQLGNSFVVIIILNLRLLLIRDILAPIVESQPAPWVTGQLEELIFVPIPKDKVIYVFHPNVQTQKITNNINPSSSFQFTQSGSLQVPAGVTSMTYCLTSGGGGGSYGATAITGAGGGGGGALSGLISVTPGESLSCTIGAGGAGGDINISGGNGLDGGNSVINVLSTVIITFAGSGAIGGGSATGGAGGHGGGDGGNPGLSGSQTLNCASEVMPGGNPGAVDQGGGGGAGGEGNGGDGGDIRESGRNAVANTGGGGGGAGDSINGLLGGNGGSGNCLLTWTAPADGFRIDPVFFTGAPSYWGLQNWPSCGAYFGGRLWAGGEEENGSTFVGSRVNDLENFLQGTGQPNEGILESIQDIGDIKWIKGTKVLLMGTTTGEYLIDSSGNVLIPGDIKTKLQSAYGSSAINPIKIGDQLIYVSADNRRINVMNYEVLKENWLSIDLTFYSEHITKGLIKQIAWSQHPNKILWVLMKDGTLSSLSYERNNDVFGWARHPTKGFIRSISVGTQQGRSILVAAVERLTGDISFEYMSESNSMDSWISFASATPYGDVFYIEGLDHLEGLEVQVLIDDINHNRSVFVGAESAVGAADGVLGRVYIDFEGAEYIIGLQYVPSMISIGANQEEKEGNDFMHEKTYTEIAVRLMNSRRPVINGMDTYKRNMTVNQGLPEPPKTELLIVGNVGWDTDAFIKVSQPLPYKLTIAAIGGQYKSNKL